MGNLFQAAIMPSKDLAGKPMLSSEQLLKSWNEFLTNKFASPEADHNRPREELVSPEDHLDVTELEECLKALKCGKAPGWDKIPI